MAALVVTPWAVWNLAKFGVTNLTSATGGIALYHGIFISRQVGWVTPAGNANLEAELALRAELATQDLLPNADIRVRDGAARELAMTWMRDHRGEALRLWLRNLALTWYLGRSRASMAVYLVLHGAFLTGAVVGVRRLWRGNAEAHRLVLAATVLIVVYTAFHAAVQPAVRYILPVVPCAALLAAGAVGPARRFGRGASSTRNNTKLTPLTHNPNLSPGGRYTKSTTCSPLSR
jgi:hypothetical protein